MIKILSIFTWLKGGMVKEIILFKFTYCPIYCCHIFMNQDKKIHTISYSLLCFVYMLFLYTLMAIRITIQRIYLCHMNVKNLIQKNRQYCKGIFHISNVIPYYMVKSIT